MPNRLNDFIMAVAICLIFGLAIYSTKQLSDVQELTHKVISK